jgi:CRP-like cAMP-binding protein
MAEQSGELLEIERGSVFNQLPNHLYLILKGFVIAVTEVADDISAPFFVSALRRGDILSPTIMHSLPISFIARTSTLAICIPQTAIGNSAKQELLWERLCLALDSNLTRQYADTAQSSFQCDQDRILRVIEQLAGHPDAQRTQIGIEVEASKEELRMWAGVHKRSASRAFKNLVESGVASFSGYKRVMFLGRPPV